MDKSYHITPIGKPRMTQRDKWSKRLCVVQYWRFKDACKLMNIYIPLHDAHVTFILPMPKSWSKQKKKNMDGEPHRSKPDIDNLIKALLDAIFEDDADVWDLRATKVWGEEGQIVVKAV